MPTESQIGCGVGFRVERMKSSQMPEVVVDCCCPLVGGVVSEGIADRGQVDQLMMDCFR